MTPDSAKQVVLVGVTGSALLAVAGEIAKTKTWPSNPRIVVGGFAAAVILSALATPLPGISAGIAAVMLLTSAFVYGGPAWQALTKSLHP